MRRNGKKRLPPREIRCSKCDAVLSVTRDLKREAVRGHKDVTELGMRCWRCKHWAHVYFDGPPLVKPRKKFKKTQRRYISTQKDEDRAAMEAAHAEFKEAFNRFNDAMRRGLGIVNRNYTGEIEVEE